MAIDIRTETSISITEATKLPVFSGRRHGARVNVSTLWRWSTSGCRGVILDTVKIGGSRATSIEAIERFIEGIAVAEATGRPAAPIPSPKSAARRKSIDGAKRRLVAAGIL